MIFNRFPYLFLSGVAAILWLVVHTYLGTLDQLRELRFLAPDSSTYLDVGEYIFGNSDLESAFKALLIRPFGYPVILSIFEFIHLLMLFVGQSLMWLASVLILYRVTSRIAGLKTGFWISILYVLLVSIPLSAVFALSEPSAILFFSLTILMFQKYHESGSLRDLFFSFLFLALSSVVRPSFFYLFLASSIAIPLIYRQQWLKKAGLIILASAPILIQGIHTFILMGVFTMTLIAEKTLEDYLLIRAEAIQTGRNLIDVRMEFRSAEHYCWRDMTSDQVGVCRECISKKVIAYIRTHPAVFFKTFLISIWENIDSGSEGVASISRDFKAFSNLTWYQNMGMAFMGLLSALLTIVFIAYSFVRQKVEFTFGVFLVLSLSLIIIYHYFITGISYYQGDRFSMLNYFPICVLLAIVYQKLKKTIFTSV